MDSGTPGVLASRDSDTSGGCWGQGVAPPPELGHSPRTHSGPFWPSDSCFLEAGRLGSQTPLAPGGHLPGLMKGAEWGRTHLKLHSCEGWGQPSILLMPRPPGLGSAADCLVSSCLVQPQPSNN